MPSGWSRLYCEIIPATAMCGHGHVTPLGMGFQENKGLILRVFFIRKIMSLKKSWGVATDVGHNLLFNYCKLLFLVFLCKKKRYFRFRWFISLFLGAFNVYTISWCCCLKFLYVFSNAGQLVRSFLVVTISIHLNA